MSPAETLSALVQAVAVSDLPALAAELARASANVTARIATAAATAVAPAPVSIPVQRLAEELLTIEEAAKLLSVKVSWLYRHWRELGCGRKIGHRTLRFERRGLERWAATRPRN